MILHGTSTVRTPSLQYPTFFPSTPPVFTIIPFPCHRRIPSSPTTVQARLVAIRPRPPTRHHHRSPPITTDPSCQGRYTVQSCTVPPPDRRDRLTRHVFRYISTEVIITRPHRPGSRRPVHPRTRVTRKEKSFGIQLWEGRGCVVGCMVPDSKACLITSPIMQILPIPTRPMRPMRPTI
jgi:hypothetical protein